jgi:hypothetical protein
MKVTWRPVLDRVEEAVIVFGFVGVLAAAIGTLALIWQHQLP